jgi:hypothetical protein
MKKKIFFIFVVLFFIFMANTTISMNQDVSMETAANNLADRGIINNHKNDPLEYNLTDNVLRQEIAAVSR